MWDPQNIALQAQTIQAERDARADEVNRRGWMREQPAPRRPLRVVVAAALVALAARLDPMPARSEATMLASTTAA